MMSERAIRFWCQRIETDIRNAVQNNDRALWNLETRNLYTLELVLDDTDSPEYLPPTQRFPFTRRQEAASHV